MVENIVTGKKYRILKDEAGKIWDRISFWTKASDVELNSGTTVESAISTINTSLSNGTVNPKPHVDADPAKYGKGTTTKYGHLMISNSYQTSAGTASDGVAASSKAVYDCYQDLNDEISRINRGISDLELDKAPIPHRSTSDTFGAGDGNYYGHVKLSNSTTSTLSISDGTAATPKAVNTVKNAVDTINANLTANSKKFTFAYDDNSKKYGYLLNGEGDFYPFNDPDSYPMAVGIHSVSNNTTIPDFVTKKTFAFPKGTYRLDVLVKRYDSGSAYRPGIIFTYGDKSISHIGETGDPEFFSDKVVLSSDTSCTLEVVGNGSNYGMFYAIGYVYRV